MKKKRSVVLDELREAESKPESKEKSASKVSKVSEVLEVPNVRARPTNKKRKTVNLQSESGEQVRKCGSGVQGGKVHSTRPTYADAVAPSVIRDVLPSDLVDETVIAGDYMVEIGGTVVPRRFYRSFFAEITSGAT